MDLTKKELELLYSLCNSLQYKGIDFIIKYETGLLKSEEMKIWYEETILEFKELQILKDKIKNEIK